MFTDKETLFYDDKVSSTSEKVLFAVNKTLSPVERLLLPVHKISSAAAEGWFTGNQVPMVPRNTRDKRL